MRYSSSKLNKSAHFQFFIKIKGNSFHRHNLTFFCKFHIFPSIYDIYPLWEKYNLLKNHLGNDHENCSLFALFFFTLFTPFTANAINTIKIHQKGLNFLCDSSIYVCSRGGKNHKKNYRKKYFFAQIQKKSLFSILVERGSYSF